MILTLGLYTKYSISFSKQRVVYIRDQKDSEKKQEFYLNESIMNYETVKAFNNSSMETARYEKILDSLRTQAKLVQRSLGELNVGQTCIFSAGLTLNLLMAAHGVSTGQMTPGDFVMIQALFMQLSGPLFNMGTFFRTVDQSSVDVEDLFFMLNQKPVVKEIEGARDFDYKSGTIEFKNLGFKHYIYNQHDGERKDQESFDEKLLF